MKKIIIVMALSVLTAFPVMAAGRGMFQGGAPLATTGANGQTCGWRPETSRNFPNLDATCQAVFKEVARDCANHVYQAGSGWSLRSSKINQVASQKGVICRYR